MLKKTLKVLTKTIKFVLIICIVIVGVVLWQSWSVEDIKEELRKRGI